MGRVLARVLAVDGHSMFYAQQKVGWFFDPAACSPRRPPAKGWR